MEQECPRCGLISPPTAEQCDCGYHFRDRRQRMTNLTEKDRAQRAADARQTYIVPASPFPGCGYLLLAVTYGTNGLGAALLLIAFVVAGPISSSAAGGPSLFAFLYGLTAAVSDVLVRRFVIRCSMGDTTRGSKFLYLPLWIVSLPPLALGGVLYFARPE